MCVRIWTHEPTNNLYVYFLSGMYEYVYVYENINESGEQKLKEMQK